LSVIDDIFVSPAHIKYNNKAAIENSFSALAWYSARPSWWNLLRMLALVLLGFLKKKDW
jgi:hypothetical protein